MYGYSFQLFYIVVLLPTQFINIYLTRNDVQKIVDSSFFTLTCVGYVAKLVVFISRRNKVEEFFQRLHHPLFTPKRKEHFEVLKDYTNVAKASSMTFMVLSMITCASWILFPLVDSSQVKKITKSKVVKLSILNFYKFFFLSFNKNNSILVPTKI